MIRTLIFSALTASIAIGAGSTAQASPFGAFERIGVRAIP